MNYGVAGGTSTQVTDLSAEHGGIPMAFYVECLAVVSGALPGLGIRCTRTSTPVCRVQAGCRRGCSGHHLADERKSCDVARQRAPTQVRQ